LDLAGWAEENHKPVNKDSRLPGFNCVFPSFVKWKWSFAFCILQELFLFL